MKEVLMEMSEELGADVTGSYILSKVAELLKLAFATKDDLRQAIDSLAKEHLCLEPVTVAVTPGDESSIHPATPANAPVAIAPQAVVPVRYNPKNVQCHSWCVGKKWHLCSWE